MGVADSFLELRPALLGAAYRILGSATEAEDVVQDAWVRRSGQTEVQNEKAWLTTVVGNLCRDRLRASAVQRAQYFGTWLPEPIITDALEQRDDVRMAALLVLQALTPAPAARVRSSRCARASVSRRREASRLHGGSGAAARVTRPSKGRRRSTPASGC